MNIHLHLNDELPVVSLPVIVVAGGLQNQNKLNRSPANYNQTISFLFKLVKR